MILGHTIVAVDTGAGGSTTVYTPWIAGWGNSGVFAYEIIDIGGASPSLSAKVFTKNTEAADPGSQKGTTSTKGAAGTYTIDDATGLLELVRMEFTLTATTEEGCCTAYVHFRPLNPSWMTN